MTDTTRAAVERLAETLRRVEPDTPGVRTRWYRNPDGPDAADTLLALLARAEAAERDRDEMLAAHGQAATDAAQQYQREMARVLTERDAARAQVAAAVEAEREAIANEHDCGCAARIDVLRMLSSDTPWRAKNFCPAAPNCCAIDAAAIRARGASSALADALRQAEARGMREAAMHALSAVPQPLVGDAGHCTISTRDICVAAILAAANAKETRDDP